MMCSLILKLFLEYYEGKIDDFEICKAINVFSEQHFLDSSFQCALSNNYSFSHEVDMVTSGTTTGYRTIYKYSNVQTIGLIEKECKYPHGKNYSILFSNFLNRPNFIISEYHENRHTHCISYSELSRENILKITEKISSLSNHVAIWTSDKNNLMFLLSDNYFVDFLLQNKERISIINTGISPFFKKKKLLENGFHINDNMIDWYSGLNFYTCKYNKKHILPIFYAEENKSTNLLNLSLRGRMVPKSDYFDYSPLGYCECGKTHYDLKFIPHIKTTPIVDGEYFYDMEIPELLEGSYYNLQFVQIDEKTLDIYYTGNLIDYDRQIIEERTKMFQFKNYKPNSVFSINHKQPPFHKIYYQKQFL